MPFAIVSVIYSYSALLARLPRVGLNDTVVATRSSAVPETARVTIRSVTDDQID